MCFLFSAGYLHPQCASSNRAIAYLRGWGTPLNIFHPRLSGTCLTYLLTQPRSISDRVFVISGHKRRDSQRRRAEIQLQNALGAPQFSIARDNLPPDFQDLPRLARLIIYNVSRHVKGRANRREREKKISQIGEGQNHTMQRVSAQRGASRLPGYEVLLGLAYSTRCAAGCCWFTTQWGYSFSPRMPWMVGHLPCV